MRNTLLRLFLIAVLLASGLVLTFQAPVNADGGPMVDPLLFTKLKERQQVAVIKLWGTSEASVDLFVSILDQTEESHEVTYFVPLGINPTQLQVLEEDSLSFANSQTAMLDRIILKDYRQDTVYLQNLFAGALLTNGVWLAPFWLPVLLSGCAAPSEPVYSATTPSSQVDVFSIDETTDIENLISTTGLDTSVKETLSRLKGQQIAVMKIKTSPHSVPTKPGDTQVSVPEPGLHLYWKTSLASNESGFSYAYPLGTGASWANPIEMSRVYVVGPLDMNFKVKYPKLGVNRSGFAQDRMPRISTNANVSAYAIDDAITPNDRQERVWRATYTNSNSAEDIVVTISPDNGVSLGTFLRHQGTRTALIVGLIASALFWILAWYYLLPLLVGRKAYTPGLWRISLTYIAWNLLLLLPGVILYIFFQWAGGVTPLTFAFVIFGGASALIFSSRHLDKLAKVSSKPIKIFAAITGASGGAYLLFALCYAWLVGAI